MVVPSREATEPVVIWRSVIGAVVFGALVMSFSLGGSGCSRRGKPAHGPVQSVAGSVMRWMSWLVKAESAASRATRYSSSIRKSPGTPAASEVSTSPRASASCPGEAVPAGPAAARRPGWAAAQPMSDSAAT